MTMIPENLTINTEEYSYLPWNERIPHLKNKFGFENLEISFNSIPDENTLSQVQALLKRGKIGVASCHHWFHFFKSVSPGYKQDMERIFMRNIEWTRQLGADKLVWYTGENESLHGEPAVVELLVRLKPLLRHAEKHGIHLLLETEFSVNALDVGAHVELLKKMMSEADTPFLGINYDPANLYIAGEEAFPYAYDELKPWIQHVHLKDVALFNPLIHNEALLPAYGMNGKDRTGLCCPLGEGAVNSSGVLKRLFDDSCKGWLCLETHVEPALNDHTTLKGIEFVRDFFKNCSLPVRKDPRS